MIVPDMQVLKSPPWSKMNKISLFFSFVINIDWLRDNDNMLIVARMQNDYNIRITTYYIMW